MKLLFLLILLSILISIGGCKKKVETCPKSTTYNYLIESATKEKTPYSGNESLVFISDKGDTAKFYGQGIKEVFQVESQPTNNNPECSHILDYWRQEVKEFHFVGTSSIDRITFKEYGGLVSHVGTPDGPIAGQDTDIEGFNINHQGLQILSLWLQPSSANDTTKYTVPLDINGKTIYAKRIGDNPYFLYNYKYGLLQFQDTIQNKLWTINF